MTTNVPKRPSRGRRREGFVLLMSLMLLLTAALLLAGLARFSLSLAVESHDQRERLQRRWGTATLSRCVLHRASEIVELREAKFQEQKRQEANVGQSARKKESPLPIRETVRLGQIDFRLLLDDENRKLNVNRVYVAGGLSGLTRDLQALRQPGGLIRLRPGQTDAGGFAVRPFESLEQVYSLGRLPGETHPARWLMANSRTITCWGNSRVHYARCSDAVLETVAERTAGPVSARKLVELRREHPELELTELLDRLQIGFAKKSRLRGWLCDESTCFTLWLAAQGTNRTFYKLVAAEASTDGTLKTFHFTW